MTHQSSTAIIFRLLLARVLTNTHAHSNTAIREATHSQNVKCDWQQKKKKKNLTKAPHSDRAKTRLKLYPKRKHEISDKVLQLNVKNCVNNDVVNGHKPGEYIDELTKWGFSEQYYIKSGTAAIAAADNTVPNTSTIASPIQKASCAKLQQFVSETNDYYNDDGYANSDASGHRQSDRWTGQA